MDRKEVTLEEEFDWTPPPKEGRPGERSFEGDDDDTLRESEASCEGLSLVVEERDVTLPVGVLVD